MLNATYRSIDHNNIIINVQFRNNQITQFVYNVLSLKTRTKKNAT